MQGTFYAPVNLMQLEDTLREHEPYATLIVSTTGLDDSTFVEHSPTRVLLTQYEYDEQLKAYKEGFAFDKLVQAPQSAIDRAIANTEYDVFVNGGIDRNAYLDGIGVLSVADFQKEFARAVSAVQESKALLIVNNTSHAEHYLAKIGCDAGITALKESEHLVDQTRLTLEYMQKNNIHGSATLEGLRNAIMPMPTACTFLKDEAVAKDFKSKSKEEFLQAYPKITPRAYGVAERFTESQAQKIVGGDNRSKVIHSFVTKVGRDAGILESELHSRFRQQDADYMESLSTKGKTDYQGKSVGEKLDTLKEMGAVNPDEIRKGNSAFHELMDAVEKGDNKGIVIFHVATTGFDWSKQAPQVTGQPIQFAALAYSRGEDGTVDMTQRPQGKSILIEASSRAVLAAEKEAAKGKYDTFKEAGIDIDAYKAGEGVLSQDKAIKIISEFFKKCPPEDYTYVVMGGSNAKLYPDRSYAQTALQNLGNFAVQDAKTIDFCQAIKDYAVWVQDTQAQGVQNVLFGDKQLSKFGVKDVAEAVGLPAESVAACKQKCGFVAQSIATLEKQQALLRGEPEKEAPIHSPASAKSVVKAPAQAEMTEADMAKIEREAQDKAFEEMLRASGELGEPIEEIASSPTRSVPEKHGRLYSDKQNDSIPVVKGLGEIKIVGEQPIPHVKQTSSEFTNAEGRLCKTSEALKQPVKESKPAPTSVMEQRRRSRHEQTSFDKSKFSEAPKLNKTPEQSAAPAPSQNNDALLKAVQAQSEMTSKLLTAISTKDDQISKLTDIVAKQQEQIGQLQSMNMQMQTMLMQTMTEHNAFLTQMAMGVDHAPVVVGKNNMVDFLEHQKEQIDSVRGQLPDGMAKKQLTSANQAITDAQKTLEQQHERDKAS